MTSKINNVSFALDFPQGHILFMENEGVYFQPRGSREAFQVYGERKELFGKRAITVAKDRDTDAGGYSVVYEFSGQGALLDARLVKGQQTVPGALVGNDVLESLNADVAQGKIAFRSRRDTEPTRVFNVARFADGRLLVQISNKAELYLGTPGNYEKVDAQLAVQGGNTMIYRHAQGFTIKLPGSGYGEEAPMFGSEPLAYISKEYGEDPSKYGLEIPGGIAHVDPFSAKPAAAAKAAFKPPGR